ncbi:bifunctional metallophosphatase/5'-nucleotidase [Actinoplanes couchii]|uniref:Multifunctional 2',3'-cyclic-nucleotide 2'-phosphodiesterase/5'-nucleotidase/3'-nucleotidase n=2 Tax=Actinoplanes couchii TaxID=403638 RepID=A0ABQ3XCA3_9ACTN|nr:multifunctional 2',3'-cyclic-nucleotide 2'-phosphodiesterase/5'-nucleotidase/3'-nucleotidase [Actinoplanes couchii]
MSVAALVTAAVIPAAPSAAAQGAAVVKGQILSYNDFHGAIDPPTGTGAVVNAGGVSTPAGGVEYLATTLKRLRAGSPHTITAGAGDLIGATPLVSAAFHDEPTIELMNQIGLQVSSVGNHEFDEGVAELIRIQRGGCHPVDGCQDGDPYRGAKFSYLAANTIDKKTKLPILPPVDIRFVGGVPVGFIGMTLEGTPGIVNPAGITGVTFTDEVQTANKWSNVLRTLGVRAQVLLLHEGGTQAAVTPTPGVSDCTGFTGPVVPIVAGLNPEIGVVVSGHTHRFYQCELPNRTGARTVVTSAGNNGQLVTDIDYTLDKRTGRFAGITATNVIVENGIPDGSGGWRKDAAGAYLRNPDTVDPAAKKVADKYRTAVAPIANRLVGSISADITRTATPAGESPLGDVIADAQRSYTNAQIALMNPGGIRADLDADQSSGGEAYGQVTYGEAFTVQPFNNLVVTQTFTGAQLKDVLEQQFAGYAGQTVQRILQVSAGLTYTWSASAPAGSKVGALALNGVPIDPAANYSVTTNDFLANGGDGFSNLTVGTGRVTAPGFDVDALVALLATGPIPPGPANRITTTS